MITIEKLFENVSYTSNADISKIKIKGIATDSRQVKDGDLSERIAATPFNPYEYEF